MINGSSSHNNLTQDSMKFWLTELKNEAFIKELKLCINFKLWGSSCASSEWGNARPFLPSKSGMAGDDLIFKISF